MIRVTQYNQKKDCVASSIVVEDFKGARTVMVLASEGESAVGEKGSDNDHEGHQWIMEIGCSSDLISKAKVEDHKMRRSKAKCPIQLLPNSHQLSDVLTKPQDPSTWWESVKQKLLLAVIIAGETPSCKRPNKVGKTRVSLCGVCDFRSDEHNVGGGLPEAQLP